MKQILVIVFPIFLRPFLGEFHPAAGPGGLGAGTEASAVVPVGPVVAPARGRGAETSGTKGTEGTEGTAVLLHGEGHFWGGRLVKRGHTPCKDPDSSSLVPCFHARVSPNGLSGVAGGDTWGAESIQAVPPPGCPQRGDTARLCHAAAAGGDGTEPGPGPSRGN